MKIDIKTFRDLVDQKLLSSQKHPGADLLIWNYTQKCQFDRVWSEETMMARGLITDLEGNIVARPFKKFFNLGEQDIQLPAEPFYVQEKFDGSLGILYWVGDTPSLATRGSFTSEQAIKGTEMLSKYDVSTLNRNYTYLFEIIYPDNRIVVDYGGEEKLVLLAVIDTETGKDMPIYDGVHKLVYATAFTDKKIDSLKEEDSKNREGFVITFQSGLRVKVKFDEYVRIHKIVTGVNAVRVWENLKEDKFIDEWVENVPDEFHDWVMQTAFELDLAYTDIESKAKYAYELVASLETRRDQAQEIFSKY